MDADRTHESRSESISMGVPYITSFCWCFSLEVGTKIISYMHLAFSLCVVMACSIMAYEAHGYMGTVEDAEDRLYSTWFVITAVIALISVVHVLLALTLVYGVSKGRAGAVRAWLGAALALLAAALLLAAGSSAAHGFRASGSDIFLYFLLGLLVYSFIGYCILCVYSYYLMLKSAEDMQGPPKAVY